MWHICRPTRSHLLACDYVYVLEEERRERERERMEGQYNALNFLKFDTCRKEIWQTRKHNSHGGWLTSGRVGCFKRE